MSKDPNNDILSDTIYIDPSLVTVPKLRMRKEFADTIDLQEELKVSPGLLTAIFVNADNSLICGEHRLKAQLAILEFGGSFYYQGNLVPPGKIPVQRASRQLTELEVLKLEFGENNFRTPLAWGEVQAAKMRIFNLQMELSGKNPNAQPSTLSLEKPTVKSPFVGLKTAPRVPETVIKDAAETFYGVADKNSIYKMKTAVKINNAMKSLPELATELEKANSDKEALQIIDKFERAEAGKKKAQEVGKTFSSKRHKVLRGDCIEVLREMEGGIYDVGLLDPPYGMGANSFSKGGSSHSYDDSPEKFKEQTPRIIRAVSRVLKPAAHLYIFCDIDKLPLIKEWIRDASVPGNPWNVHRTPFIMVKTNGVIPRPGFSPRRTYEVCVFADRGGKQNTGTITDVLNPVPNEKTSIHGAAKQPEAIMQLLAHSCKAGDKVIDPTAGTGATLVAAHKLLLEATLIELDETFYGICVETLNSLK
jgi:site-specific DNA-methyltransferase (adenine-specific)